jgi:regulation of enolase protein 1 (concanavalin A-like superfamily)
MQRLNEPRTWQQQGDVLIATADAASDSWRLTHSGTISDSGHLYYEEIAGDFVAEVAFSADYRAQYDQAGIMVRENELVWLKCGVELVDDVQQASVAITREFSDWSLVPLKPSPAAMWLRVARHGPTMEIYYSLDGQAYTMLRQGYLSSAATLKVGPACACPTGDGLTVRFTGYRLQRVG